MEHDDCSERYRSSLRRLLSRVDRVGMDRHHILQYYQHEQFLCGKHDSRPDRSKLG